jgi:hypothetical protein
VAARSISVRKLQQALKVLGNSPGTVDGQWGPRTGQALSKYLRFLEGDLDIDPRVMGYSVSDSGTVVTFENRAIVDALEDAAARFRAANNGAMIDGSGGAMIEPVVVGPENGRPFFRMDNPMAWAVGIGGVMLVAGGSYYLYQRSTR